jgi:hypothetical protein
LAVNAAVRDKPAKEKLEFFGNSFFIPIFFIVTGFLINPVAFFQSITTNFPLASAVIGALLIGKWIAAQTVGRAFAYTPAARMTMWSLTLPQVAATLAATLVAFDTRNPAGQRLVDSRLLNVVLVLMVTTSILGPVLTEHFAPRLLKNAMPPDRMKAAGHPDSAGMHRDCEPPRPSNDDSRTNQALGGENHPTPRVINTDKHAAYPPAIAVLQAAGDLADDCQHPPVQYLNNVLEQDHRAIKRRINASQHFRSFWCAWRTIAGYKAIHLIRKGQAYWSAADAKVGLAHRFILGLFAATN